MGYCKVSAVLKPRRAPQVTAEAGSPAATQGLGREMHNTEVFTEGSITSSTALSTPEGN